MSGFEKFCRFCKKRFFPEEKVVRKVFCGEELVCVPPGESYDAPDCRVYEFCSEECLDNFSSQAPTCTYVPGWKRLMDKISKAGSASGITGTRLHHLHKSKK